MLDLKTALQIIQEQHSYECSTSKEKTQSFDQKFFTWLESKYTLRGGKANEYIKLVELNNTEAEKDSHLITYKIDPVKYGVGHIMTTRPIITAILYQLNFR